MLSNVEGWRGQLSSDIPGTPMQVHGTWACLEPGKKAAKPDAGLHGTWGLPGTWKKAARPRARLITMRTVARIPVILRVGSSHIRVTSVSLADTFFCQ